MSYQMNFHKCDHIKKFKPIITDFCQFCQEKFGFKRPPSINFLSDKQNEQNPLGKTAYYNPDNLEITVFVDGRHIKDILRSISHEMVHHNQNLEGQFDGVSAMGEDYAQTDDHLRKMEKEAYLLGSGIYFRDWEDQYKKGAKLMSEWKKAKEFEIDLELLTEGEVKNPGKYKDRARAKAGVDKDGDGVPNKADKDPLDGSVNEETEEDLHEYIVKKQKREELESVFESRFNKIHNKLMNKWCK